LKTGDGPFTGIVSVVSDVLPARDNVYVRLAENDAIAKITVHDPNRVKAKVIVFPTDARPRLLDAILLAGLLHLGWAFYHLDTTMCGWFAMNMSYVLYSVFGGTVDTTAPHSDVPAGDFFGIQVIQPDASFLWPWGNQKEDKLDKQILGELKKAQTALRAAPLPTAGPHKIPVAVLAFLKELYKTTSGPESLVRLADDVRNVPLEVADANPQTSPICKLFRRWRAAADASIKVRRRPFVLRRLRRC
jgi:hypothetical protein